jgi:glycosyltransferase involved in cell wall biosynthesis
MPFRSHNITPPEFVVDGFPPLARLCFRGRRELSAFAPRCDVAVGASEFSRQELERLGFTETGVLPAVPDFSHLDEPPDRVIRLLFDDAWTNILFVGRIIPNKKFEDLIRFYAAYHRDFNRRSRLLLVGSAHGFDWYLGTLHDLVRRLKLEHVHFAGQVSNAALAAYYDVADLFLCASEHEGFCVPLVEAFYARVPVAAFAATAVPATLDGGGVLYTSKDPFQVAALVDTLTTDDALRESVLAAQDAALARLLRQDFPGRLLALVERALAAPRRPAPPVAFDFRPGRDGGWRNRSGRAPAWQHVSGNRKPGARGQDMVVNQWVPAVHRGGAAMKRAAACGLLRRHGPHCGCLTLAD